MPRKTVAGGLLDLQQAAAASMRPRPDAAENLLRYTLAEDAIIPASMRPRPDAAENILTAERPAGGTLASMRPRPDAAENTLGVDAQVGHRWGLQ